MKIQIQQILYDFLGFGGQGTQFWHPKCLIKNTAVPMALIEENTKNTQHSTT